MREIKFRAWDIELNELVVFNFPRCIDQDNMNSIDDYKNWCQFTGLKDKNGKEIYEGDIIRHTNEEADGTPYEVPEISPENWEDLLNIGDSEWDIGDNQYSNIEIIGNIYENSELLEDK